jgi:hypothetical protein
MARLVTAGLLVLSLGLHWPALQSLAWAGMIVAYSQEAGVRQGLAMTFDGAHPCPLCKAVEKGRAEEEQPPDQKPSKPAGKLDPAQACPPTVFEFQCPSVPPPPGSFLAPQRGEAPPKPRPRLAPA